MAVPTPPRTARPARPARGPSLVRAVSEAFALLAVAVATFQAFAVEGYVISSGSMAPGLFGFHKRVECPTCAHTFARGVAFDPGHGDDAPGDVNADESPGGGLPPTRAVTIAACPNCGQPDIDVSAAPDTQGDQLLVLKHAFAWRTPRRWEVVVFRHPDDARQAYVKRVVGLPGERVRVRDGDVWADGNLCRKNADERRAVRIPVFDPNKLPAGEAPRWAGGGWVRVERPDADAADAPGGAVRFETPEAFSRGEPGANGGRERWRKLVYRHRPAAGGTHVTRVRVDGLPAAFDWTKPPLPVAYDFDPAAGELRCRGVLNDRDAAALARVSRHPRWRAAVAELGRRSHFAPITDAYGYNRAPDDVRPASRVRDFSVALSATVDDGAALAVELTDGGRTFLLAADRRGDGNGGGRLTLHEVAPDGTPHPGTLRDVNLPAAFASGDPVRVEFALFDRRATAAVNGAEAFPPLPYDRADDAAFPGPAPAVVGARGAVRVTELMLYRDVHYTRGRAVHGVEDDYELRPGELFVLGDNSPVSLDSRGWEEGAVPEHLLVGKPFVVHLPSRPGTLNWGAGSTTVRIPDPSRVRWVR